MPIGEKQSDVITPTKNRSVLLVCSEFSGNDMCCCAKFLNNTTALEDLLGGRSAGDRRFSCGVFSSSESVSQLGEFLCVLFVSERGASL